MNPNTSTALGRLERVDVRKYWAGEATDFTPWLAMPENIALLGEAIGLDLEVQATEEWVGPFRADILCKDTVRDHYVLIENQLERTDHGHLGQLITYAAGLDAVTVVWVANRFTAEHRAALDWLNRVTEKAINFFGLEIELWRIGDSPWAPKFNAVSQPNDWSELVKEQAAAGPAALSPTQQLNLEFWTQLKVFLEEQGGGVRVGKPSSDHWRLFPVGRTHFTLSAANSMQQGWSAVSLVLTGPDSKPHFYLLRDKFKEAIESALGPVDWEELPGKGESRLTVRRPQSPADRAAWPQLNEWMARHLESWGEHFRPIVKALDAREYQDPNELVRFSDD